MVQYTIRIVKYLIRKGLIVKNGTIILVSDGNVRYLTGCNGKVVTYAAVYVTCMQVR